MGDTYTCIYMALWPYNACHTLVVRGHTTDVNIYRL